jgi:hypothetical protein
MAKVNAIPNRRSLDAREEPRPIGTSAQRCSAAAVTAAGVERWPMSKTAAVRSMSAAETQGRQVSDPGRTADTSIVPSPA